MLTLSNIIGHLKICTPGANNEYYDPLFIFLKPLQLSFVRSLRIPPHRRCVMAPFISNFWMIQLISRQTLLILNFVLTADFRVD